MLARFRDAVDDQLASMHRSPASIDRDGLLRGIETKLASGETPSAIAAWIHGEMQSRWLSFAPIAPKHAREPLVLLPFDRRVHWIVSQGVAGQLSHTGEEEFAFDFVMPEGTPILAAKPGTVARVTDGFTHCCQPKERAWQTNSVIILHRGGTFSVYGHLRKGVEVREGQSVEAGDRIGYSGSTGYANGPHLHFEVAVRTRSGVAQSIPIRFRNYSPDGYVPEAWKLYENRPHSRLALRVSIAGSRIVAGRPFRLADRTSLQLAVEVVSASGAAVDVTRMAGTQYFSLTPWSMRIDRMGRAHFDVDSRIWGVPPEGIVRRFAIATIVARDGNGNEGYFDALFAFADTAQSDPNTQSER